MSKSNYFAQHDLGGIDENDFLESLREINNKNKKDKKMATKLNPIISDVIEDTDKIVNDIFVVDKDGNKITRIKSYNNLTKEAVIYLRGIDETETVILEGSRIVFRKHVKDA